MAFADRSRTWIIGALIALVVGVMFLWYIICSVACYATWYDTGYNVKYRFISGCLVEQSTGKWLPQDKVRPE